MLILKEKDKQITSMDLLPNEHIIIANNSNDVNSNDENNKNRNETAKEIFIEQQELNNDVDNIASTDEPICSMVIKILLVSLTVTKYNSVQASLILSTEELQNDFCAASSEIFPKKMESKKLPNKNKSNKINKSVSNNPKGIFEKKDQ